MLKTDFKDEANDIKKGHQMSYIKYAVSYIYPLFIVMVISGFTKNISATIHNFVIVIPSYNNAKWYKTNLQSVLSQNYPHFRVIYTDDCSPDGTGDLVQAYLAENDHDNKVCLIKNSTRRGALHNLYTMIHMTHDNDIIVTLDGDDWLPDKDVLTRLNDVYSSGEVWLTYGQFKLYPSETMGWASPMPNEVVQHNAFRYFTHLPSHLRTFSSWLFKKIKLDDLLYQGTFYSMTWDMAMMIPMIEMAGERHKFVSDVMYVYNDQNPISDHHISRQFQAHLAQIIKKKSRYARLSEKPCLTREIDTIFADVVIFAYTPKTLTRLLESFETFVDGIDKIFVMYKPTSDTEVRDYNAVQALYSNVEFCLIKEHRSNFQDALFEIYQKIENNYILFSKGDTYFKKPLSLHACIGALQDVSAHAFYFKLTAQEAISNYANLPIIECRSDIFAWTFAFARGKWSSANSLDLVLHKKTDFFARALKEHYDLTPSGLELILANEGNLDRLGLCFNESYVEKI